MRGRFRRSWALLESNRALPPAALAAKFADLADRYHIIVIDSDNGRADSVAQNLGSALAIELAVAFNVLVMALDGIAPKAVVSRVRAVAVGFDTIGRCGSSDELAPFRERAYRAFTGDPGLDFDHALDLDPAQDRDWVLLLERTLRVISDALLRQSDQRLGLLTPWRGRTEGRVLACLALLLPAVEQSRFVSEALGNLGACEHWWRRMDHLVCLAIGTPRLAWMMRREGRRGRV